MPKTNQRVEGGFVMASMAFRENSSDKKLDVYGTYSNI
jgi:hypothetical protein